MKKILVIGSTGFLGQNIIKLKTKYNLKGTHFKNKINSSIYLNLHNHYLVNKIISSYSPSIVIDSSNFNIQNVNSEKAIKINNNNMTYLISVCNNIGARLLFISSDMVFDGKRGNYKEIDIPNPINLYGTLKHESEILISHLSNDSLIVRTSLLFGWNNTKNFVLWIIENLRKNNSIQVINDQYISPSYCPDISKMILETIYHDITGTIHLAGNSQLSRFEFAKLICKIFLLNEDLLIPIKMSKIDFGMKRGKYTTLNVEKATNLLRHKPVSATSMLTKMKKDEKQFSLNL